MAKAKIKKKPVKTKVKVTLTLNEKEANALLDLVTCASSTETDRIFDALMTVEDDIENSKHCGDWSYGDIVLGINRLKYSKS